MIKTKKIINLIGVDGSGKTTLSKMLLKQCIDNGLYSKYFYFQYIPKLLIPLKILAKLTFFGKVNQKENYQLYRTIKARQSQKYQLFLKIYSIFWIIDYLFQMFIISSLKRTYCDLSIIDRYVYDIAINLSLSTNNKFLKADEISDFLFKFLPKPNITVFIDVPIETAFYRKTDIPSLLYLDERRRQYIKLSEFYNFYVINGADDLSSNCKYIFELIQNAK